MSSRSRHRQIPVQRRSKSAHQSAYPYQSITETYSKEIVTRPIGQSTRDDLSIPGIVPSSEENYGCDQQTSPPLIRRSPNRYPDYPVIRVKSPTTKYTELYKETIDYEEHEKYTTSSPPKKSPPKCNIIPASPQKECGIALSKKLPMYEEFLAGKCATPPKIDENHNSEMLVCRRATEQPLVFSQNAPIARPRSKSPNEASPQKFPRGNLRYIDSDDEQSQRYLYTHDVFVDTETGRPYTPGRHDLDDTNCGKLKINVYFKPPQPPIKPTYTLDEIEIEKASNQYRPPMETYQLPSKTPSRTSILRKESEITTIPLTCLRTENDRVSIRTSESKSDCRKTSERSIPIRMEENEINMDEIFPKMTTPLAFKTNSLPKNCSPGYEKQESKLIYDRSRNSSHTKTAESQEKMMALEYGKSPSYERSSAAPSNPRSSKEFPRFPKYGSSRAGPSYEEVVHLKERYERDETIRRFYPTTTAV